MWPNKPYIYEINTAVWLTDLSKRFGQMVKLDTIPDEVLDELADLHVDAIWLMGIWQRSEAARRSALNYTHEYKPVLPDLTDDDVSGSAYAVGAYEVDKRFGGREALVKLRKRLWNRSLRLVLDFVPNHVSTDHAWLTEKPHYMVRGTRNDLENASDLFFKVTSRHGQDFLIAHGRDPYFPGWIDTAQLNAFSMDCRAAVIDTLNDIASQCDGVRCDMAMLMLNNIFDNTWGAYLQETAPDIEFWDQIIPAVKAEHPECIFIAEVYWDMEYTLLQQGFDFTYDKRLYDRLQEGFVDQIHEHLEAAMSFQRHQLRFIENHDEQRAASALGIEKSRAAAVLICTLPGGVLLHDGQFSGRTIKLPVQINRQPEEHSNRALERFYSRLLQETRSSVYHEGSWRLFEVAEADEGNFTNLHLIAYGWVNDDDFRLIVINFTHRWSQGRVKIFGWDTTGKWRMEDTMGGSYRLVEDIDSLYVEMEPFQARIFRFERIAEAKKVEVVLEPETVT